MKTLYLFLGIYFTNIIINAQCTLNNSSSNYSTSLSTSGNTSIDNIIKTEKVKLENFFDVKVDLKICSGSNGLAKKNCQNYNCNGTIELGNHLLIHEFSKQGPFTKKNLGKNMVLAIMAHEFAHIFQYTHPEFKFKNAFTQEVHADMLAGWYIAQYLINEAGLSRNDVRFWTMAGPNIKPKFDAIEGIMMDIEVAFGWMGDEQYWSPQHHGDYFTRISAFGEAWECMRGGTVQISCDNYSYWLKESVWIANQKVYSESDH